MGSYVYRGYPSKRRYEFFQQTIPAELLGPYGQPLLEGTFNGETLVNANHDGSVARSVASGPPVGASPVPEAPGGPESIYDAYIAPSLWEQLNGP